MSFLISKTIYHLNNETEIWDLMSNWVFYWNLKKSLSLHIFYLLNMIEPFQANKLILSFPGVFQELKVYHDPSFDEIPMLIS